MRTHEVVTTMVRFLLAERRQTQADLARALGLSQPSITARFHGRVRWSVDDLDALAAHFAVPVEQIVEGAIRVREPIGQLVGSQRSRGESVNAREHTRLSSLYVEAA